MNPYHAAIQKYSVDYDHKITVIDRANKKLQHDVLNAKDKNKYAELNRRFTENSNSMLPLLYRNLKKNADVLTNISDGSLATPMEYKFNKKTGRHEFPDHPIFEKAFNKALPTIKTLANWEPSAELDDGTSVHPCCLTHDEGELETDYLNDRFNSEDMGKIDAPKVSEDTVDWCDNKKCQNCMDCRPHQDELIKSVRGLLNTDDPDGDGLRIMHAKNLITTLASWNHHQHSRGYDEKTCLDDGYNTDAKKHAALGTAMSSVSYNLSKGLNDDWVNSGGKHGCPHRDDFNIGKNREAY